VVKTNAIGKIFHPDPNVSPKSQLHYD